MTSSPLDTPAGPAERRALVEGLSQGPPEAARFLLGQMLVRRRGRSTLAVRIVETEAYLGEGDPAAHAFRGRTRRTDPLWGPPGTLYVYLVYGMHHCVNIAVERIGSPGCVLIRAGEPLPGVATDARACRGPGRLCRTLHIDTNLSGASVFDRRSGLWLRAGDPPGRVGVSTRVGLRKAADRPLRFFDEDSPAVSAGPS